MPIFTIAHWSAGIAVKRNAGETPFASAADSENIRALEARLAAVPGDADAAETLGYLKAKASDFAGAAAAFRRAAELAPSRPGPLNNLGNISYLVGDADGAIGWWENELVAGKIKWSAVTRNILEVSTDFEPGSNSILFFIKEEKSRQWAENVFSAAIINGVSFDINLPFETAKGKSIKVRFTGFPDFENGQCIRIYGFIQPINE